MSTVLQFGGTTIKESKKDIQTPSLSLSPLNSEPHAITFYKIVLTNIQRQHCEQIKDEEVQLEKKYKRFTDIHSRLEESKVYHRSKLKEVTSDGQLLAEKLISEYQSDSIEANTISEALRIFIEAHLHKISQSRSTFGKSAPWVRFDDAAKIKCINQISNCELALSHAREYLFGFMENVCDVSIESKTNHGVLLGESASWIIARHPFGQCMATFLVSIAILFDEIGLGKLSKDFISLKIKNFVSMSQEAWSIRWKTSSNKRYELKELLYESIQHALFINAPFLPYVLHYPHRYEDDKVGIHNWTDFPTREVTSIYTLLQLYNICGVPARFMVFEANVNTFGFTQEVIQGSPEIQAWSTFANNDFLAVSSDIHELRFAKTPREVALIADKVSDSVIRIASNSKFSGSLSLNAHVDPINEDLSVHPGIGAEELIPLMTFVFSLYMRTPVEEDMATHELRYRDAYQIIALMKFADTHLPDSIRCQKSGYALTVCTTAILNVPL